MKKAKPTSGSPGRGDAAQLARFRMTRAERDVKAAKEQARLAKRRRKEARQAARRAKKQFKQAKAELAEAKRALEAAEQKPTSAGGQKAKRAKNVRARRKGVKSAVKPTPKKQAAPVRRSRKPRLAAAAARAAAKAATLIKSKSTPARPRTATSQITVPRDWEAPADSTTSSPASDTPAPVPPTEIEGTQ